jgi:hypothetical protein
VTPNDEPGPILWRFDLLAGSIVALVTIAIHWRIRRLWWLYDDAFQLRYVIRHSPREYLVSPEIWREIGNQLFTPLLMVSYDLDWFLFEGNARGFYLHHLAELALFAVMLYATARLWRDRISSVTFSLLVILGAAFCSWSTQLMVRHYVESSIAALAATMLFIVGRRRGRGGLIVLSALAYFVAICAKEIAVPLPLLLLLSDRGAWRGRVGALVPHGIALAIYAAWRYWMLGTFFGGYGWAVSREDVPMLLASLLPKVVKAWLSPSVWVGALLLAVLIALAMPALRTRRAWMLTLVAIACALLPIAPVSKEMQLRYAVVPWIVVAFAAAAGLSTLRRTPRIVAAVVAISLAFAVHLFEWRRSFGDASRMTVESKAFLELADGALLRNPLVPPAAMGELQWLKTSVYHRNAGAAWSFDDIYYCTHPLPSRVIEFQRSGMRDVTPVLPKFASRFCASRAASPLEARFDFHDGSLFWELGPYSDGQYRFILGDGVQAFDVPRRDGFRLGALPGIALRIAHRAPNGEVAYSPAIAIDFAKTPQLQWRGTGEH